MKLKCLTPVIVFITLLLLSQSANCAELVEQRQIFLQAEKYIAEKNDAGFIAASEKLNDYVLYPYLRYQWLKDKLDQTEQILAFLSTYKDSRYASTLRSKWLNYIADQVRWADFVRYYQEDQDSADDCQWQWARYETGKKVLALIEAKRLWLAGKVPDNKYCQKLLSAYQSSTTIPTELLWQRFETALENNHLNVAHDTAALFKPDDRKVASHWLKLHQQPQLLEDSHYWQEKTPQTGRLFAHAIKRLVSANLEKALQIWDLKQRDFLIDSQTAQSVERKIGMMLLGNKDSRAYDHLEKIQAADEDIRTARVRAALLEQNWQHVSHALTLLTMAEQQEPKWQYWLARALHETGKQQQAINVYAALAKDRSYYGFLAADTVKVPYQIVDLPVIVAESDLTKLAEQSDFKACLEFKWLNRDLEVRRQWQFAIKDLPKEKLLLAAKLAQHWQFDQLAITTLVKADYWDDMALRFPLAYLNEVQASAEKHHLESALIYGLMRQESMLDKYAESSVGAKGLMQLMPNTGMTIARELHEPWQSAADLFKPDINIHFGSHYFKELLAQFKDHVAVAGAAYNAGPHRAKKWLPIGSTVPADIWIETIPFKETRKYVSTVLSYVIIYQHRLNKGGLKLKSLLKDIMPG